MIVSLSFGHRQWGQLWLHAWSSISISPIRKAVMGNTVLLISTKWHISSNETACIHLFVIRNTLGPMEFVQKKCYTLIPISQMSFNLFAVKGVMLWCCQKKVCWKATLWHGISCLLTSKVLACATWSKLWLSVMEHLAILQWVERGEYIIFLGRTEDNDVLSNCVRRAIHVPLKGT